MSGLSNESWSRRRFLRHLSRSVGALAFVSGIPAIGRAAEMAHDHSSLIVRLSRPQDLETPVENLDSSITPNSVFFVRSHFGPPAIIKEQWKLEMGASSIALVACPSRTCASSKSWTCRRRFNAQATGASFSIPRCRVFSGNAVRLATRCGEESDCAMW